MILWLSPAPHTGRTKLSQFCHLEEKCVRLVFAQLPPTDSGTFNYTFIIFGKMVG